MGALLRGAKNAVRSPGRALAVTVILGLSLALALSMAVAKAAVDNRVQTINADAAKASDEIASTLASVGNVLLLRPAGSGGGGGGFGFQVGGNQQLLDPANLTTAAATAHVASVSGTYTLTATGSQTSLTPYTPPGFGRQTRGGGGADGGTTRTGGGGGGGFTPPLIVIGTDNVDDLASLGTGKPTLVEGRTIDATSSTPEAIVGKALADNQTTPLHAGSTFTLKGQTVTVVGVFTTTGNRFGAGAVVMPLKAVQSIAGITGVTQAFVRVDSTDNVAVTQATLASELGGDVDVVNEQERNQAFASQATTRVQEQAAQTTQSLDGVAQIASASQWGALGAATVIVILAMYMVVRERRKEIGVLKALGSSTGRVVAQYATEALVLTAFALVVGLAFTFFFGSKVAGALVASNTSNPGNNGFGGPGGGLRVFGADLGLGAGSITASLDWTGVLLGLLGAVAVAVLGSVLPALAIARVRPSETLRGD